VKAAKNHLYFYYFSLFVLRRVLFEKVQHIGDCGLTGRFADNHKPPAEKQLLVTSFQEVKNIE
jgi:hypothetical protein